MRASLSRIAGKVQAARRRLLCAYELILYRGDLPGPLARPEAPPGFSLGLISPQLLSSPARREELARVGSPPRYAEEKWQRGEIGCALFQGERLVGAQWASTGPTFVPEVGREVQPTPRRWYLHDMALAEQVRGRRLAAPLVSFTLAEISARGGAGIFTLVETDNYPSQRTMLRCGLRDAGRARFIRAGLYSWLRYEGQDPEARGFFALSGC
jgi:hypothetical protein